MSLPSIHGTARLLDDPELRFGPSGVAVCKVRLAFNSRRKNPETQEWEDADSFFVDGAVFKEEAENVAQSLQRGTEVVVTGRLKTRRYETKEGEKRSATELMIDSIGPTLKFATVKVEKLGRSGGTSYGAAPAAANNDPWSTPASGAPTEPPPF